MALICALPGCEKEVTPPRKKFCSNPCRIKSAQASYLDRRSAELQAVPLDQRVIDERERLRRQQETKTLMQLQRSEAKRQEYIDVLRDIVPTFPVTPYHDPARINRGNVADIAWGIDLSDWQVGQHTPIQSTGGIYEQTTEIAARQLDKVWEAIRQIYDVEVGGGSKRLRDLWLNFIGDLIDGDCLRPAQAAQIDRVATRQVLEVCDLAALFIRRCLSLPGIERIVIDMVGGNHDRTSAKAGNAGLGELDFVDTYAFLIGHWLKTAFAQEPRVDIKVWETFYGYRKFGGLRHAFEHGASFKGGSGAYGGVPWYPISNAAQNYIKMLGGVDIVHMGHWHQPAILPLGQGGWTIMNGALPVSSQFIQSSFKGLRAPLQWMTEYNVKHEWVNNFYPLYADVGQFAKAGTVWLDEDAE